MCGLSEILSTREQATGDLHRLVQTLAAALSHRDPCAVKESGQRTALPLATVAC